MIFICTVEKILKYVTVSVMEKRIGTESRGDE